MKVASPSLTMWNIFSHIYKLIVSHIAEKFPVFCGIRRFTAAIQVYCNFQQSFCTLQPFIRHRRFDDSFASSSVAVTDCSSLAVRSLSVDFSSCWTVWPRRIASSPAALTSRDA
jgi:hypothetical protein